MLAAAPAPEAQLLEIFRLALGLAKSQERIPQQLAAYFEKVLAQARQLESDPTSKLDTVMPEAVQLAVNLREREGLRLAVKDIGSMHSVTPSKAADVLRHLEAMSAS